FDVNGDLLGQVAVGDGRRDRGDVSDLGGEVTGHEVDAVGEVLPGTGNTFHLSLSAELPFGTHFTGDAAHFRREGPELFDHGIHALPEPLPFAFHVDGDLLGQVAVGDGGGDCGDVSDLAGEVTGHRVDAIGEVLPGAGNTFDVGLPAELSFRTD